MLGLSLHFKLTCPVAKDFGVIKFWLFHFFTELLTVSSWVSMIAHPMLRPFRPLVLERCVDSQYLLYWASSPTEFCFSRGSLHPNSLHKYITKSFHWLIKTTHKMCLFNNMSYRQSVRHKTFFIHSTSVKIFKIAIQDYLNQYTKLHDFIFYSL